MELLYFRCKWVKIILNNVNKVIELKEIIFFGYKIISESMKVDDVKIKVIIDMFSLVNIFGVKRFCVVV